MQLSGIALISIDVVLHGRLLFLPDGRKDCIPIVRNRDIKSVEPYSDGLLFRGITAIKITSKGNIEFD